MDKKQILKVFNDLLTKISIDNINRYMRNHFPSEYAKLLDLTSFLNKFDNPTDKNKKISILERIYCITHNLTDRPKCKHCKTAYVCGFNKQKREYRKWCSAKCQASDPDCIAESKRSRLVSYGSESYNGTEKAKATRLAKNNGKWHAADFGDKVKSRKISNGHSFNWVNPEKAKDTKFLKYGDMSFNNKTKNKITRKTNFYNVILKNQDVVPMFSLDEYLNGDKNTLFKWKCLRCGTEFQSRFNYNFKCLKHAKDYVRCLTCFPYETVSTSNEEFELFEFIRSLAPDALQSDRSIISPFELDIYIPSKNLAVEFDGLYWHSDENKPSDYHLNKTNACTRAGVKLIHVFEDEWREKRAIVESRLKNILGACDNVVFARKCAVANVDLKTARDFQNANHLQGAVNASVRIGLFHEDELVALMTFGRCRFDKAHEWEMLRFCCKLGWRIPGAASKLLHYFEMEHKPKSLISYADKRWSTGSVYSAIGFTRLRDSKPGYFYVKDCARLSRMNFQKHMLPGILEKFDAGKTEAENMKANGYSRIYDCGNMVFEKTYN